MIIHRCLLCDLIAFVFSHPFLLLWFKLFIVCSVIAKKRRSGNAWMSEWVSERAHTLIFYGVLVVVMAIDLLSNYQLLFWFNMSIFRQFVFLVFVFAQMTITNCVCTRKQTKWPFIAMITAITLGLLSRRVYLHFYSFLWQFCPILDLFFYTLLILLWLLKGEKTILTNCMPLFSLFLQSSFAFFAFREVV